MSFTSHAFIWACLQIAALGGFALIVAWFFRGSRPQGISALLTGVCIAILLIAAIAVFPEGQWTIVTQTHFEEIQNDDQTAPLEVSNSLTNFDQQSNLGDRTVKSHQHVSLIKDENLLNSVHLLVSRALLRFDRHVRESQDSETPVSRPSSKSFMLALIAGMVLMMLLWLSSWLYLRRVFRSSVPINDPAMLSLVDEYSRGFAFDAPPVVRESSLIEVGATVGWIRPTIFLHSDWKTWSEQERAAVIAHELAHVYRRDYLWVVIATWAKVLLFFHPVVHILVQRLRAEQELAADQLAAGKVGNARAYGRALASLALRVQPSLKASSPKLGSMLAIGQICVTRRVIMLRQGSLKPIQSKSRLCFAILLAGACSAIPFTGLRGSAQEGSNDPAATAVTPTSLPKSSDNATSESKNANTESSSLSFEGAMVYRPGRLRAGEFGAEAAWIQDWFTASIVGKPIPDKAVLYGRSYVGLRWDDETREHGRLDLSANVTEANSTLPGQMQSMSNFIVSVFSRPAPDRVVANREVHGRSLVGITESPTSDVPEKWMIDDEQGFFIGSLDDAERFTQGQRLALDAIPQVFRDDYTKAAFAMVYSDCGQWANRIESFTSGSPRESEFKLAVSLLRDVKQMGLFVDGCKSPACTIRVITANDKEAEQLAKRVGGLLEVAKLAIRESKSANEEEAINEFERSVIETIALEVQGNEVVFSFDIFALTIDNQSAFAYVNRFYRGWQIMHFSDLANASTLADKVAYVMPNDDHPKLPGLFSQTINAKSYRGKRVTFEIDMQCDEQGYMSSGAFVWASRHEEVSKQIYGDRKPIKTGGAYTNHRMLAARTMAMDGVSTFRSAMDAERTRTQATNDGTWTTDSRTGLQARPLSNDKESWQTVTVSVLVPEDAEHLSFGCYSKNRIVKVRNGNFKVSDVNKAGSEGDALGYDAVSEVPFNLLVVPGYQIESTPSNLDFSVLSNTSVGVAEQPAKTDSSSIKR